MKFLKAISTAALALTLVACSSAPSDADVQAVTQQSLQQVDQQLAPLGLRWSDVFDTQVKVKNKAKQEDGRWLIEAETTVTAKKDLKELPETAQMLVHRFRKSFTFQPFGSRSSSIGSERVGHSSRRCL